jgi:hypothetical protein
MPPAEAAATATEQRHETLATALKSSVGNPGCCD